MVFGKLSTVCDVNKCIKVAVLNYKLHFLLEILLIKTIRSTVPTVPTVSTVIGLTHLYIRFLGGTMREGP